MDAIQRGEANNGDLGQIRHLDICSISVDLMQVLAIWGPRNGLVKALFIYFVRNIPFLRYLCRSIPHNELAAISGTESPMWCADLVVNFTDLAG